MRDTPAAGSDVGESGNGRERIIGWRETQTQYTDPAAWRRVELDGTAFVGRTRELSGQSELVVVAWRQFGERSSRDLCAGIVANHRMHGRRLPREVSESHTQHQPVGVIKRQQIRTRSASFQRHYRFLLRHNLVENGETVHGARRR